VTIKSNSSSDNPLVNPRWLTDPRDQEVAVACFKEARAVFTTSIAQEIVLGPEAFPGLHIQTDREILDLIKASAAPIYHSACTCRMGKSGDKTAVVDSKARVFGIKGLRVVDASAFPLLPPGHPTATICKCSSISYLVLIIYYQIQLERK
jgi:choline dehydrogenase